MGCEWYERMEKYFLLCSEFHAFLAGVIECIFWKVLKFVSFCSDLAKSLGLGRKWNGMGVVQISFLLGAGNAGISWVLWIFGWILHSGVMS